MTPQELKSSILQLAIQGKLVEQRPEEGTGEELYQQIQAEKKRLMKEGKIKKEKPLPEIAEDEVPFEIPESWAWVRLNSVISLLSGSDLTPDKYNTIEKGIPYITGASNIEGNQLIINRWTEYPNNIARKGDLLLTCKGTVGKTIILVETEVHIARQIMALSAVMIDTVYLKYFIEGQVETLKSKAKSMIPGIERDNVLKLLMPLPPLAEQKRIVAKIEELLPYLDRYEKAWNRLEDFGSRFPVDMQKSILQMAIQGKLVEQRPEEGTGEELYRQIQAEKQALIKAGKIKKEKPLPEIAEDEVPFEIPEGWKWVYLLDIIREKPSNGYSPKGVDYITPIRNLTLTATTSGRFREEAFKYVDIPETDAEKYWLKRGDLLVQRSNSRELVGISCIYTGADNAYIYPDLMMRMRVMNGICTEFVDYALKAPMVRSYYMANASGTSESMPKINQKTVSLTPVPLPPLAEQKRIVARLEEILPLCERLK